MYWDLIATFFLTALTAFGITPPPVQQVHYPVLPDPAQKEIMYPVVPAQMDEQMPVEDSSVDDSGIQITVEDVAQAYQPEPYVPPVSAMTIPTIPEPMVSAPSAEATSACSGKKQGVFCTFWNDEGNVTYGTCIIPSNTSSLACVSR